MAQLNAFHAHILEACAQRDLTEPEALRQVKAMGYDGLECDCRQLTKERRQWFDDCGLKVASVYENYDFGYAPREENERQIRRLRGEKGAVRPRIRSKGRRPGSDPPPDGGGALPHGGDCPELRRDRHA